MTRAVVRSRGAVKGFSLIEVIVALVVISGFGGALFVWAGQTLQIASRAAQVQQQTEIERNVSELAFSLNPALQDAGELQTGEHRYRWQATVAGAPADQLRPMTGGASPWQVGLYKVRFTVTDVATPTAPMVMDRIVVGYRQVRPRASGPPGFTAATPTPTP